MSHSPTHSKEEVPVIDRKRGRQEAPSGPRHPDCHRKRKDKNWKIFYDAFCLSFRVIPVPVLVQWN